MSIPHSKTTIPFTIGETDVKLMIGYNYVKGAPSILNDVYGGDPGYPPEVNVLELSWKICGEPEASIEFGALFEFIATQDCVIQACIEAEESNQ